MFIDLKYIKNSIPICKYNFSNRAWNALQCVSTDINNQKTSVALNLCNFASKKVRRTAVRLYRYKQLKKPLLLWTFVTLPLKKLDALQCVSTDKNNPKTSVTLNLCNFATKNCTFATQNLCPLKWDILFNSLTTEHIITAGRYSQTLLQFRKL